MPPNTRFSERKPRAIDDGYTAQSGDPLTWADIWQGVVATIRQLPGYLLAKLRRWFTR